MSDGDAQVFDARVPPNSEEAEKSVLGAIFLDNQALVEVADTLRPSMFYQQRHGLIYKHALDMLQAGKPVDLVTMTGNLQAAGILDGVGGTQYLMELANFVPTAAHAAHYAGVVREKAIRRGLLSAAAKISELAFDQAGELSAQTGEAEQALFRVTQATASGHLMPMVDVATEHWEARFKNRKAATATGLATGYSDLDYSIGGLQPADLVVLAARPSQGKTALAINIATRVAKAGTGVAVFSLEMSNRQLSERVVCAESFLDSGRVRANAMSDQEWAKVWPTISQIGGWPLWTDDQAGLTSLEMRSRARRLKAERGLGLVVIDYLQLIGDRRDPGMSRAELIDQIMARLKAMAKELEVPVLVLSQLNREVEHEKREPRLSDLRESGGIEQAADLVWFIHWDPTDSQDVRRLIIAKNRNGPVGTVKLAWLKTFTRFENLTARPAPAQQPQAVAATP